MLNSHAAKSYSDVKAETVTNCLQVDRNRFRKKLILWPNKFSLSLSHAICQNIHTCDWSTGEYFQTQIDLNISVSVGHFFSILFVLGIRNRSFVIADNLNKEGGFPPKYASALAHKVWWIFRPLTDTSTMLYINIKTVCWFSWYDKIVYANHTHLRKQAIHFKLCMLHKSQNGRTAVMMMLMMIIKISMTPHVEIYEMNK